MANNVLALCDTGPHAEANYWNPSAMEVYQTWAASVMSHMSVLESRDCVRIK